MRTAPRDAMIPPRATRRTRSGVRGAPRPWTRWAPCSARCSRRWCSGRSPTATTRSWWCRSLRLPRRRRCWAGRAGRTGRTPERRSARAPAPLREVATPRLVRLLAVAGVLGLLTVGDGFLYLALLDRGASPPSGSRCSTSVRTSPTSSLPSHGPARGPGRPGAGPGARAPRPAGAYFCAALPARRRGDRGDAVLLGAFYAATDGVLSAVAGQQVPERLRASGIASAQTVVALTRMVASAGFGSSGSPSAQDRRCSSWASRWRRAVRAGTGRPPPPRRPSGRPVTLRQRYLLFGFLVVLVMIGGTAYALGDLQRSRAQREAPPTVASNDPSVSVDPPLIAFRHTGLDEEYGMVAPGAPRPARPVRAPSPTPRATGSPRCAAGARAW